MNDNFNESILTETSNSNYKTIQTRCKTPSKINIHNLYINKKIQIGKNFSKLKIDETSLTKPSSPLIHSNQRKLNRKIFNNNNNSFNTYSNQNLINPSSKSNKIPMIGKKFVNEKINKTIENLRKNSLKKLNVQKSKEYIIDNRKLSIVDIPSIHSKNLKKNLENYKINNFCMILAKSNILPLKLRLMFAVKSKLYSKEEILSDYKNCILNKKLNIVELEKQFKPFKPSKTIQCFLGFINKEQENEFINNHMKYNFTNENDVILFNMFKILYILLNKEISSDDNDLIKDFFEKIFKELKIDNLKTCILDIICNNFSLSEIQLNTLNMIFKNIPKIIDNQYYKSLEKDKISFTICLFIKEIYIYSKKKFTNGKNMIMYLNEKKEQNKQ